MSSKCIRYRSDVTRQKYMFYFVMQGARVNISRNHQIDISCPYRLYISKKPAVMPFHDGIMWKAIIPEGPVIHERNRRTTANETSTLGYIPPVSITRTNKVTGTLTRTAWRHLSRISPAAFVFIAGCANIRPIMVTIRYGIAVEHLCIRR